MPNWTGGKVSIETKMLGDGSKALFVLLDHGCATLLYSPYQWIIYTNDPSIPLPISPRSLRHLHSKPYRHVILRQRTPTTTTLGSIHHDVSIEGTIVDWSDTGTLCMYCITLCVHGMSNETSPAAGVRCTKSIYRLSLRHARFSLSPPNHHHSLSHKLAPRPSFWWHF